MPCKTSRSIWSRLRSAYLAQANVQAAQAILAGGGAYDAGWYWDTSFDCYAFLPVGGIQYSPFGWGFSAPGVVEKLRIRSITPSRFADRSPNRNP